MKGKFKSRVLIVCLLSLAISFGARQAFATDDEKRHPVATICCAGGNYTGNATDCTSSTIGACDDTHCNLGETEESTTCPN
jgi:hypothetical protein